MGSAHYCPPKCLGGRYLGGSQQDLFVPGALPLCYQYTAGEWTSRTQLEREHGEQRERLQVSAELQRAPPPSFNALSSASRRTLIDRGTPNELVLPDLLLSDLSCMPAVRELERFADSQKISKLPMERTLSFRRRSLSGSPVVDLTLLP